ncbi:hypothetical protein ScPMuIL_003291 [Solemya velum]
MSKCFCLVFILVTALLVVAAIPPKYCMEYFNQCMQKKHPAFICEGKLMRCLRSYCNTNSKVKKFRRGYVQIVVNRLACYIRHGVPLTELNLLNPL